MDLEFFQLSAKGIGHSINEDAIASWAHDDGLVFAIADGIGQRAAGQIASTLALEILEHELADAPSELPLMTRLRRGVQAANVELYQKSSAVPELAGMGTTLTATALTGATLFAAHVGDCRLWLLRGRTLTQLTKDHTWVWAHLPGVEAHEHAHGHPRRYSLPRCLGHELILSIDLLSMELRAGDLLVQCSDGMHAALSEGEIRELLEAHPPEAACRALVRRACEEDGRDDVSVQVAAVRKVPAQPRSWWRFGR